MSSMLKSICSVHLDVGRAGNHVFVEVSVRDAALLTAGC